MPAVLVAEDDPTSQLVTRMLLRRLGHDVDVVGDGVEAVAAVRSGTYDVVLMDVQMPGLDGLAATRRIRADPSVTPQPVIVAVTAGTLPEEQQACTRAGMDGWLAKPLRPQAVADVLESLLRGTPTNR